MADEELKDEKQRCNGVDREQQKGLERAEGGVTGVLGKICVLLAVCPPQIPHESPWDREPFLITMMIRILILCWLRERGVRGVNLAAHLHLVSRLRTSGAIIRLSHIFMTYKGSSFPELGCFLVSERTNSAACTAKCFITNKCTSDLHEHCGTSTNNA